MTAVKICGITRPEDAEAAARFGASYVGFVLWPKSPRAASLDIGPADRPGVARERDAGRRVRRSDAQTDQRRGRRRASGSRRSTAIRRSNSAAVAIPVIRAVHLAADRTDGIEPDIADELILLDAHDPVRHGGTGTTVDWQRAHRRRADAARHSGRRTDPVQRAEGDRSSAALRGRRVVGRGIVAGIKDHGLLRAFIAAATGTRRPQKAQ